MQIKILQTEKIKVVDEIIKASDTDTDTVIGYRSGCVIYRPELVEVLDEEKPKKVKNAKIS